MNSLSERVKKAMQMSGISQADLAVSCKIKQPSVNDWISGKTQTMKAATANRAASAMGVNVEWLSEGIGPMQNAISITDVATAASVTTSHAIEHDPILADLAMLAPLAVEEFRLAIKYAADLQRARQRAAQASQQPRDVDKELRNQTSDPPQETRRAA